MPVKLPALRPVFAAGGSETSVMPSTHGRPIRSATWNGSFRFRDDRNTTEHPPARRLALLLSADLENEPDTLGIIGASAALYFSDIPFTTPIGAVKVGYLNNEFVINPTVKQLDESSLNMVVVGTEEGIVMLEAGASEIEEEKIIEGIAFASETINQIIEVQSFFHFKSLIF